MVAHTPSFNSDKFYVDLKKLQFIVFSESSHGRPIYPLRASTNWNATNCNRLQQLKPIATNWNATKSNCLGSPITLVLLLQSLVSVYLAVKMYPSLHCIAPIIIILLNHLMADWCIPNVILPNFLSYVHLCQTLIALTKTALWQWKVLVSKRRSHPLIRPT